MMAEGGVIMSKQESHTTSSSQATVSKDNRAEFTSLTQQTGLASIYLVLKPGLPSDGGNKRDGW